MAPRDVDIPKLREGLKTWGVRAVTEFEVPNVYVFGSLVYKSGAHFSSGSDIDLVITLPSNLENALQRTEWIERFFRHKYDLEIMLLDLLGRSIVEPFASIVLLTQLELSMNVHKDNLRDFFSENTFENLLTDEKLEGLPSVGSTFEADRLLSASLSFVQRTRNIFLGVAANNRSLLLLPYAGEDPIPKSTMRAAAMVRRFREPSLEKGAEYDTKKGLDFLFHELYELAETNDRFRRLNDLVSERRLGRGPSGPLSESDQLLLAEIVFDLAAAKATPGSSGSTAPEGQERKLRPSLEEAPAALGEMSATVEGRGESSEPRTSDAASAFQESRVLFHERFLRSFPGVRQITWFEEPSRAIMRLEALLEAPLLVNQSHPIWWWRGGNLQIERFTRLSDDVVLMNYEELKIARIAAVPGRTYKRSFVYVEVDPMEPTGVYPTNEEWIRERIATAGYVDEEYGIYKQEHLLTRGEYDDGAKEINGVLINTAGEAELRVRYITPYNFVIAAQASPINNANFDRRLEELLNMALRNARREVLEMISEEVHLLPLKGW
jgi:hypothetical protein